MAARKQGERKLAANVWVGDPAVLYEAGSTPPKEHAELITNPKAWDDSDSADSDS